MSFTDDHALQCDCDSCLNRGGGATLASLPEVVATTPDRSPPWRQRRATAHGTSSQLAAARAVYARQRAKKAADLAAFQSRLAVIGEINS